jgi:hypothetical protein
VQKFEEIYKNYGENERVMNSAISTVLPAVVEQAGSRKFSAEHSNITGLMC